MSNQIYRITYRNMIGLEAEYVTYAENANDARRNFIRFAEENIGEAVEFLSVRQTEY